MLKQAVCTIILPAQIALPLHFLLNTHLKMPLEFQLTFSRTDNDLESGESNCAMKKDTGAAKENSTKAVPIATLKNQ